MIKSNDIRDRRKEERGEEQLYLDLGDLIADEQAKYGKSKHPIKSKSKQREPRAM